MQRICVRPCGVRTQIRALNPTDDGLTLTRLAWTHNNPGFKTLPAVHRAHPDYRAVRGCRRELHDVHGARAQLLDQPARHHPPLRRALHRQQRRVRGADVHHHGLRAQVLTREMEQVGSCALAFRA